METKPTLAMKKEAHSPVSSTTHIIPTPSRVFGCAFTLPSISLVPENSPNGSDHHPRSRRVSALAPLSGLLGADTPVSCSPYFVVCFRPILLLDAVVWSRVPPGGIGIDGDCLNTQLPRPRPPGPDVRARHPPRCPGRYPHGLCHGELVFCCLTATRRAASGFT